MLLGEEKNDADFTVLARAYESYPKLFKRVKEKDRKIATNFFTLKKWRKDTFFLIEKSDYRGTPFPVDFLSRIEPTIIGP